MSRAGPTDGWNPLADRIAVQARDFLDGVAALARGEGGEETVPLLLLEVSQILLAGEHKMYPITGFDIGNSPQAFTPSVVEGKTIIITTTNGTRTLLGVQNARDIVIASYVNFSAALVMMKVAASSNTDIAIICAGEEGSFTLEDAACAGRYVRAIPKKADSVVVNDAAAASVLIEKRYGDNIAKVFKESSHGQALASAGFGDDLAAAAEVDSYPVVPIYQDRQITKLGPERAR